MFTLRQVRKERKMSQDELAKKSGVSRVTIYRIESEKGFVTTTTTLCKLADALGVPVGSLFSA